MALLIGTSGWQYRHWRDTFYPRGLPQRAWLEYYAARFATVESNAAFYRLPEKDTFEAWADLLVISSPQLTMPWCPPSSQRRSRVEKSVGR